MFGAPREAKQLRSGAADTGSFLSNLVQNPQATSSFLGRTPNLLGGAGESLLGLIGGGGLQAGQGVIDAALPGFERGLQAAQGGLSAQVSSPFSSAFAQQGIDLSSRALQDFNLFQAQQLASGQERAINAANILGQLAQTEQGGRLGILGNAVNFFGPIAAERAQAGGAGGFLGGLLGTAAGAFGGPLLGGLGAGVAENILGRR